MTALTLIRGEATGSPEPDSAEQYAQTLIEGNPELAARIAVALVTLLTGVRREVL